MQQLFVSERSVLRHFTRYPVKIPSKHNSQSRIGIKTYTARGRILVITVRSGAINGI